MSTMAKLFALACFVAVIAAAASQFAGLGSLPAYSSAGTRDPRSNPGPVLFPMTQPGSETSGVVIGASGYGFVPPGARGGIGPDGSGPSDYSSGFHFW